MVLLLQVRTEGTAAGQTGPQLVLYPWLRLARMLEPAPAPWRPTLPRSWAGSPASRGDSTHIQVFYSSASPAVCLCSLSLRPLSHQRLANRLNTIKSLGPPYLGSM